MKATTPAHYTLLQGIADTPPGMWAAAAVLCILLGSAYRLDGPLVDDHSLEQALADDALAAQAQQARQLQQHQQALASCLQQRGQGAAPVYDEAGQYTGKCLPRWGRS